MKNQTPSVEKKLRYQNLSLKAKAKINTKINPNSIVKK
jgi:hypothetical protein